MTCFLTWPGIHGLSVSEATDEGAGDRAPGVLLLSEDTLHLLLPSRPILLVLGLPFPFGRRRRRGVGGETFVDVGGGVAEVQRCTNNSTSEYLGPRQWWRYTPETNFSYTVDIDPYNSVGTLKWEYSVPLEQTLCIILKRINY